MWWFAHIRLGERGHGNHFRKTIWDWESQPYQVSNMNHTLSKLPIKLHLLVCQVCCRAGARIIMLLFFSRFVVHQIVFYFVVPGLVCLLGNCCWWFLCNVCNLQSFVKVTIGSGTDKTWGLLPCILNWFFRALNGAKKRAFFLYKLYIYMYRLKKKKHQRYHHLERHIFLSEINCFQTHVKSVETGWPVNCFPVVHQMVLQCVHFFAVSRAPNRAPMRAFIRDLSCAKLCCMVSIMLKVCALVIILFVLWKMKKVR